MNQLYLCRVCHRHVKSRDTVCPFCRSAMPDGRAAALAAVVAVGISLGACGGSVESGNGGGTTTGTSTGGTTTTTTTTTTPPVCNANTGNAPCDTCVNAHCCTEACVDDPTCVSCVSAGWTAPSSCYANAAFNAFTDCMNTTCGGSCMIAAYGPPPPP